MKLNVLILTTTGQSAQVFDAMQKALNPNSSNRTRGMIETEGTVYHIRPAMRPENMTGARWDAIYVLHPENVSRAMWEELKMFTVPGAATYLWQLPILPRLI